MIEIGLNIDEPAWEDYPFVSEDFFHNRLSLFFEHMIGAKLVDTPSKPVEISITLTNDAHIRILNNDYRKKISLQIFFLFRWMIYMLIMQNHRRKPLCWVI